MAMIKEVVLADYRRHNKRLWTGEGVIGNRMIFVPDLVDCLWIQSAAKGRTAIGSPESP